MARGVLAMTGRRSPWGGSSDNGGDGSRNDGDDHAQEPGDSADPEVGADEAPDSGAPEDRSPPPSKAPEQRGPRNPWLPTGTPSRKGPGLDDIFRGRDSGNRNAQRPSAPGGGNRGPSLPQFPMRPELAARWIPWAIGAAVIAVAAASSIHVVGQKEEGIVTQFGRYSRTLGPGVSLTLPWPVEQVAVTDVTSIKIDSIPEGESEMLMLTSDKNLVDLTYLVRWNIKNLRDYSFQIADPQDTVREVAEASMRASIAQIGLDSLLTGAGRGQVEDSVRDRMQRVLDSYHAGVLIQGVEIKKADPPAKVVDAFQQVTVAQQGAERDRSNARAWSQQLLAGAQGAAEAFNKEYAEYKLAPEVTKRRMWYETMERVLRKNGAVIDEGKDGHGAVPYLPLPAPKKPAPPADAPAASSGDAQ
ncbi:protease modulator HflK [Novosphingobium sp. 9]|uniref:protease modulator HflK n=1 Tax=Novosphingobium sp. 9 TaxID=2025349 RepID=UPI0021B606A9|nr:protease modulator HflK [Novosphingobium sp. 9]